MMVHIGECGSFDVLLEWLLFAGSSDLKVRQTFAQNLAEEPRSHDLTDFWGAGGGSINRAPRIDPSTL